MTCFSAMKRAGRGRRVSQSGAMLLEVLVAVVITAAIAGPLAMAFVTLIRSGPVVEEELNRSADAQRVGSAWTRDVQNVEVGGVNAGIGCGETAAPEVNLVSFRWNTSSDIVSAGGTPKTASWVAVGAGEDLQIVRRYCEGEQLVDTDILATKVGRTGVPITSIVRGPNVANPTDFCPITDVGSGVFIGDSCTIVIDGTFEYTLTVTRRVPDRTGGIAVLPPPAPTITGAAGRNEYMTVAWDPPVLASGQPPITAYRVFAYLDPNGAAVATAEVDGLSTTADVLGVSNDVGYWVRVQAQNPAQWGELSPPFGIVTPTPTVPESPTITLVEALNGQVSVSWTPPLNNGGLAITEWRLYAQESPGTEGPATVVTPGTATSGVISGLLNGRSYTITVTAVNPLGEGTRSAPSAPTVPFGPAPAPAAVLASAGEGGLTVRWTPPAEDNGRPIVGYSVLVYAGAGQTTPQNTTGTYATAAQAACATTCETTVNVANAQYYRVAVRPRSDIGGGVPLEGTLSGLSGVLGSQYGPLVNAPHVRPSIAPSAPSAPAVALSNGSIAGRYKLTATFALPADNGANAHRVEMEYQRASTANPSSWSTVGTASTATSGSAGTSRSVSVDNLESGYHYRARVRVANRGEWTNSGDRWSGWSGQSSSVVGIGTPGPPTAVVVSRPGGSFGKHLVLTFNAPGDTGGAPISSYDITCTAPSGTTISRTSTTAGTIQLTGDDVRDGRNYSCSVTASNGTETGSAGSTSATAMPYGECTLGSDLTQHIKEGSGVQTNRDNFWVRQRWQNLIGINQNYREAGLIRWTWTNACTNGSTMATSAYVNWAQFGAHVESTQDYDHDLVRNTTSWSTSTQWSNQPSYGESLGDINARSTGWKLINSDAVRDAVNQMRAGTNNFGFQVRNPTTSCYGCSGNSARYSGASVSNRPRLAMTFFSQGA